MIGMWVITLTYDNLDDVSPEQLIEISEGLDVSVARIPGRGVDFVVYSDESDPMYALELARKQLSSSIGHELISLEVVTEQEHERRAEAPTLPELVSAPEVGEMLGGVSRQRVYQLQKANSSFPKPLFQLRTGPIWDASAVEKFASTWERKPGRPRAQAS